MCHKCCFCVEAEEFYVCTIWNTTIFEPTACKGCYKALNLMKYVVSKWRPFKIFLIALSLLFLAQSAHAFTFSMSNEADQRVLGRIYHLNEDRSSPFMGQWMDSMTADMEVGSTHTKTVDLPAGNYKFFVRNMYNYTWAIEFRFKVEEGIKNVDIIVYEDGFKFLL